MSLGTIKDYTPNFNLIIPEFNISGWHDYLEENFRSIDALFYNLFGINNYSGIWEKLTSYTAGQVVFIGEDEEYSGRLVKVLVNHTTTNDDFSTFFANNPTYYELFADASTAQYYAIQAKDWATKMDGPVEGSNYSAKYYADLVDNLSTEITTLYNITNDIQTVANISTDVENVADNGTNIATVASMQSDINDVVAIKSDIEWIADNDTIVTNVSNNSTKITTVANNISSVNTIATNITDINAVASNQTNINTTATNISAINTNASNISVIQDANTNAQSALNSKNMAQYYAEIAQTYGHPLYVGEIIQSTVPLTDAGLHLLDGSVILGSGAYSQFVTYIASLVSGHPDLFETEANWQSSVSAYGVCGKFVYDSVNNTVRLPKITGFVEGVIDPTKVGDLNEAGLPNITGSFGGGQAQTQTLGAFYVDGNAGGVNGTTYSTNKVGFNASRSNSIYGNSATVQPQSINILYYIVIATSTKTDIQVDIDEIVTDLNAKADKSSFQVVSVLPVNPDADTFYFIEES